MIRAGFIIAVRIQGVCDYCYLKLSGFTVRGSDYIDKTLPGCYARNNFYIENVKLIFNILEFYCNAISVIHTALPLASSVTLAKLLIFSELQFPHL